MLLNIRLSDILEAGSQYTKNIPLALAIGSIFVYEILTVMPFSLNNVTSISLILNIFTYLNGIFLSSDIADLSSAGAENIFSVNTTLNPVIADTSFNTFLQIQSLGHSLYTYGGIWLILCSIILLLAMVAPIFISKINNAPSK